MKMLSAITVIGLSALSGPGLGADYWPAYIGADRGMYIDAMSIRPSQVAEHRSLSQVTFSLSFPVIGGAKVAYVLNDKEIDCRERRVRDLSMAAYSETGSALVNSKREGGWQPIGSGPAEDRLFSFVCGSQPPANDVARFGEIKDARADYLVKYSMLQLGK
jgi:hypothetical protein